MRFGLLPEDHVWGPWNQQTQCKHLCLSMLARVKQNSDDWFGGSYWYGRPKANKYKAVPVPLHLGVAAATRDTFSRLLLPYTIPVGHREGLGRLDSPAKSSYRTQPQSAVHSKFNRERLSICGAAVACGHHICLWSEDCCPSSVARELRPLLAWKPG